MVNAIWTLIGFFLGILSGFIGNYFWDRYKLRKHRASLRHLCGLWVELFTNTTGGHFALGAFYWDNHCGTYRYDGTRFDRSGAPIYHWSSRSLFSDDKLRVIVTSYEHVYIGNTGSKNEYGLARIEYSLEAGGNSIRFVKGVFSDRDNGNYVDFQMRRFSEVAKDQPLQERLDEESRIKLGVHLARSLNENCESSTTN